FGGLFLLRFKLLVFLQEFLVEPVQSLLDVSPELRHGSLIEIQGNLVLGLRDLHCLRTTCTPLATSRLRLYRSQLFEELLKTAIGWQCLEFIGINEFQRP